MVSFTTRSSLPRYSNAPVNSIPGRGGGGGGRDLAGKHGASAKYCLK